MVTQSRNYIWITLIYKLKCSCILLLYSQRLENVNVRTSKNSWIIHIIGNPWRRNDGVTDPEDWMDMRTEILYFTPYPGETVGLVSQINQLAIQASDTYIYTLKKILYSMRSYLNVRRQWLKISLLERLQTLTVNGQEWFEMSLNQSSEHNLSQMCILPKLNL